MFFEQLFSSRVRTASEQLLEEIISDRNFTIACLKERIGYLEESWGICLKERNELKRTIENAGDD